MTKEKYIRNKLVLWADTCLPRIYPKDGGLIYNHKCHHNTKQYIEDKKADKAAAVLMFDNGHAIAHFLPVRKDNYYEVTLGYRAKKNEYFLIKIIDKKEFDDPDYWLSNLKKYLIDSQFSFLEKLFYRIKEEDI